MVGRKLVERLAHDGSVGGAPISRLTLVDLVDPPLLGDRVVADLSEPGVAADLVEDRPDLIFHLAAVVSGEAEADLEKGYRVNLDGTRSLLDAVRERRRRVPSAGRLHLVDRGVRRAVPGGDRRRPPRPTPLTSYGTQKAIGELLLSDYTPPRLRRRRRASGCRRSASGPGSPNRAASGFFSSIIREPLNGQEAVLPVPDDVRHWFASPRAAVGFLVHAADARRRRARHRSVPDDARGLGDRGRADRGAAPRRRRRGRPPDPARARRDDHADRRRLAGPRSTRAARSSSASVRRRTSTRSSASTSRTSSAAASEPE